MTGQGVAVQQVLFTPGGRPYSLEAERRELKVMIIENLVDIFHWWNEGRPLEIDTRCPECGDGLKALVMPTGLSTAYCQCGWSCEVKLEGIERDGAGITD